MTASPLPAYIGRKLVQERLLAIFPEGVPFRTYCTRDIAGATVFSLLYVGAVEGADSYLAPKQVYRMSDAQAARSSDRERAAYADASLRPGFAPSGTPWYADTTREPIRDETLRQGLIPAGAVRERRDLPTTSSRPRYQLAADFASLFNPALSDPALSAGIAAWQKAHLSAGALARVAIVRAGAARDGGALSVTFPNGETQRLGRGQSSLLTKAVIEDFAGRFLREPAVLWVSESGNKVVARHDALARSIGLEIDPSKNLPDVILADLGDKSDVLLVFVEVVATDGPITEKRRAELMQLAHTAGFDEGQVAFVTAFLDRNAPPFRKTFAELAWRSFVWFASEPGSFVALINPTIEVGISLQQVVSLSRPPARESI